MTGVSWAEWKRWTSDDIEISDFDNRMAEHLNIPQVRQFMADLGEYLDYCRVLETARHMEDSRKTQRTYCEALRDLRQKLTDITNLHERFDYGRTASGGARRY